MISTLTNILKYNNIDALKKIFNLLARENLKQYLKNNVIKTNKNHFLNVLNMCESPKYSRLRAFITYKLFLILQ